MRMKKITKVGLLSLIVIVQVSTIVGGFIAYQQMTRMLLKLQNDYTEFSLETEGIYIDFGLIPNPFAPLFPLVLLGLFSAIVLLFDEIRHKNV